MLEEMRIRKNNISDLFRRNAFGISRFLFHPEQFSGYIYHLSMLPTNELRIEARRAAVHYSALQLLRFTINAQLLVRCVSSYLAISPLPLRYTPGGLVSAALSCPGICSRKSRSKSGQDALCCPDFPPRFASER